MEDEKHYYTAVLTEQEAHELLETDLYAGDAVGRVTRHSEKYGYVWDQQQFDALVSLSFNSGYNVVGVMHDLKAGMDLYDAFGQVVYSGGKRDDGLVNRREAEADMYLNGIY